MYKMRGYLKSDKTVHDIKNYIVNGSEDINFESATGNIYEIDDFGYFIIPAAEFKTMAAAISRTGRFKKPVKTEEHNEHNETENKEIVEMAVL